MLELLKQSLEEFAPVEDLENQFSDAL